MATVIDALMVTLGLDPAAFKKGAKEAEDAQGKLNKTVNKGQTDAEKAGKKAAEQMGKFRNEVLRTTAALLSLGAIKAFVESVTQSDIALGKMSANANTTVGEMSALKVAAEAAGSSGDSFAASLQGIAETVTRFSLTGEGGESLKYFRVLKINVADASGQLRDTKDIALDAADALSKMSPTQAQVMGKGMGFSADDVAFLRQGRDAVKAFYDEAGRANARTPEDVKNAQERRKAWVLLTETFSRLATNILNKVSPALVWLANFVRDHAGVVATLIGGVTIALTTLSAIRFVGLISQLAQVAGALRGVGAAAGVANAAGASGTLAKGIIGKLGLAGASIGTGFELWNLGSALKDWWDISHRQGVKLSASAAARQQGVGGTGGDAGSGDKQGYLSSLEKQFGLPTGLLDAVWKQESGRGKNKLSRAGAKGDFQFMDKTASAYGVLDPNDFGQSAMGAARMYSDLLKQYKGNLPMALAGYNFGAGNLAKNGMGNLPSETQGYIRNIMGSMRGGGGQTASNTSTAETHIGSITVQTQATEAGGIARDIRDRLRENNLAMQANQGLTS